MGCAAGLDLIGRAKRITLDSTNLTSVLGESIEEASARRFREAKWQDLRA